MSSTLAIPDLPEAASPALRRWLDRTYVWAGAAGAASIALICVLMVVRRVMELVSLVIAVVATSYLAWWACLFTFESWQFNELAQGLWAIPIWIPQMSFALGSLLFLVAVVDEFVIVARGGIPTFVRLVQERHAKGDFSSDL
jgi:hypothetical protein